jgi:osmotically inducible protein OsmC
MAQRNGSAQWRGDLETGSGSVTVGDGIFEGAYSFQSRFGEGEAEGTNPEQLIAAAEAACFSMALSSMLSSAGHTPDSVRTTARVEVRNIEGAPTLTRIDLDTVASVPGIEDAEFQRHAQEAKAQCPISRALAGIDEIALRATLD